MCPGTSTRNMQRQSLKSGHSTTCAVDQRVARAIHRQQFPPASATQWNAGRWLTLDFVRKSDPFTSRAVSSNRLEQRAAHSTPRFNAASSQARRSEFSGHEDTAGPAVINTWRLAVWRWLHEARFTFAVGLRCNHSSSPSASSTLTTSRNTALLLLNSMGIRRSPEC